MSSIRLACVMKTRLEKLSAWIAGEADEATRREILGDLKHPESETAAFLRSLVASAKDRPKATVEVSSDRPSAEPVPSPRPTPRGSVWLLVAASVLLALG